MQGRVLNVRSIRCKTIKLWSGGGFSAWHNRSREASADYRLASPRWQPHASSRGEHSVIAFCSLKIPCASLRRPKLHWIYYFNSHSGACRRLTGRPWYNTIKTSFLKEFPWCSLDRSATTKKSFCYNRNWTFAEVGVSEDPTESLSSRLSKPQKISGSSFLRGRSSHLWN